MQNGQFDVKCFTTSSSKFITSPSGRRAVKRYSTVTFVINGTGEQNKVCDVTLMSNSVTAGNCT